MKKPITITNIEESLYTAIKNEAVSRNITTSELVSNIFQAYLDGKAGENVAVYVQKQKCETLQGKIELLNDDLEAEKQKSEEMQNMIHVLNDDLDAAKNLTDALQEDKVKLSEQIKDLEAELAAKTAKDAQGSSVYRGVFVDLTPLELALINHVAAKEQERHKDSKITPSSLLKAMFVNYTIHGDMYFFPHPSRSTLRALKAQVEEKEKEEEENNE